MVGNGVAIVPGLHAFDAQGVTDCSRSSCSPLWSTSTAGSPSAMGGSVLYASSGTNIDVVQRRRGCVWLLRFADNLQSSMVRPRGYHHRGDRHCDAHRGFVGQPGDRRLRALVRIRGADLSPHGDV